MAYLAWFMDESLFGMRVWDALRSVEYALGRVDVAADELEVVGQGAGALWALYAAALDPRIVSVTAEHGLLSYRMLAQVDRYTHGAGIFLRGVLQHFDLPHVAAAIAPRRLTLRGPVDAMGRHGTAATRARSLCLRSRSIPRQRGGRAVPDHGYILSPYDNEHTRVERNPPQFSANHGGTPRRRWTCSQILRPGLPGKGGNRS